MTMIFFLSTFCLLTCVAISHLTMAVLAATVDQRELPLTSAVSVIDVQGWGMEFPANFISDATIKLPDARTSRHCLESCYGNITGCRFVQYDLDTWQCTGFRAYAEGTFRPDNGRSLLTVSSKQFSKRIGGQISFDDLDLIYGADGQFVANGGHAFYGEALCVMLCHIHPRCRAFDFDIAEEKACYLHSSNIFVPDAGSVAYMS